MSFTHPPIPLQGQFIFLGRNSPKICCVLCFYIENSITFFIFFFFDTFPKQQRNRWTSVMEWICHTETTRIMMWVVRCQLHYYNIGYYCAFVVLLYNFTWFQSSPVRTYNYWGYRAIYQWQRIVCVIFIQRIIDILSVDSCCGYCFLFNSIENKRCCSRELTSL